MKISKEIPKAQAVVRDLLEEFPQTRDCDRTLFLAYVCIYHGLKEKLGDEAYADLKQVIMQGFNYETIRRTRALIQSGGELRGARYFERRGLDEQVKEALGYSVDGETGQAEMNV